MGGTEVIRILTADDHPLVRDGIAALISTQPDMTLVAEAANGLEACEAFRKHRPDVTLMDLQMPVMGGVEALTAICEEFSDARIVVLTTYDGDAIAIRAIKAGAKAYLLKSRLRTELFDTIRAVHHGQKRIDPLIAERLAEHITSDALTAREVDVLRLIAEGNSNGRIAKHLSISEETVKAHVRSLLSKLDANDRTHAVTIGIKRGILDLE
jgi:DNA-binding NarL/FixJ family response regulator